MHEDLFGQWSAATQVSFKTPTPGEFPAFFFLFAVGGVAIRLGEESANSSDFLLHPQKFYLAMF